MSHTVWHGARGEKGEASGELEVRVQLCPPPLYISVQMSEESEFSKLNLAFHVVMKLHSSRRIEHF